MRRYSLILYKKLCKSAASNLFVKFSGESELAYDARIQILLLDLAIKLLVTRFEAPPCETLVNDTFFVKKLLSKKEMSLYLPHELDAQGWGILHSRNGPYVRFCEKNSQGQSLPGVYRMFVE